MGVQSVRSLASLGRRRPIPCDQSRRARLARRVGVEPLEPGQLAPRLEALKPDSPSTTLFATLPVPQMVIRGISGQCTSGTQVSEEGVERRLPITLATDVVCCSRLMVNAGVILVASSPAFAYHDTVGGGAAIGGGGSIGAVLPIVVGAVLLVVAVGIWGRKKRKTKSKRRKRRN